MLQLFIFSLFLSFITILLKITCLYEVCIAYKLHTDLTHVATNTGQCIDVAQNINLKYASPNQFQQFPFHTHDDASLNGL